MADDVHVPWRGGSRALRSTGRTEDRVRVHMTMTASERDVLQAYAKLSGKSVSLYVRDKLLYSPAAQLDASSLRDVQADVRTIVRDIRGEATNVNQIAHWANANGEFPEEASEVASELRAQARRLAALIERLERLT